PSKTLLMKYLPFLLVLLMISCGGLKDKPVENDSADRDERMPWTFDEISGIILETFPEAYPEFLNISFSQLTGRVTPEVAYFYIPTVYFSNGKLNQETVNKRTDQVLVAMGDPGSCHEAKIGDSYEFAWHSWEDKVVTKVTIRFYIGC
ncbi:MAG: hypothetical protein MK105_15875, partial [Crocinitomicaceae bacterium]|nr:hypothetical protein [Crocinitomicaceae bacterium]